MTVVGEPGSVPAAERLRAHVRPADWRNPRPGGRYDLVVLGGGTAGLVAAIGAAGLGARVALVERHLLGGDCLNTGCVPSKALLRASRLAGEVRRARLFGIDAGEPRVDFATVTQRMRERRADIAAHDSAERLRGAGVDVFFGEAQFTGPRAVQVAGVRLDFRRALIATGGRPQAPPVPGLDSVSFHTSETIFDLSVLPSRLLVLGAGPIGCELAQAFARFGSTVTLFEQAPRILPRDDPDAAALVARSLAADGVSLKLGMTLGRVERDSGGIAIGLETPSGPERLLGDALLVAAGRAPNVEGLRLEAAGVAVDRQGVIVNDRLQTSNPRIFASGDVCSAFKFTHAADALSRIALQNALFFGRRRASALVIPWVTFTDPEVAQVGASVREVVESGGRLRTITVAFDEIDRAIVDDETDGFVRVHHDRGVLRGCTIVGRHAGDMIAEVVYAMTHGGTLPKLSSTVHPYPTTADALRRAGDHYRRASLTPGVRRWLERYFRWTR